MVPLRFISENLNASVGWNGDTQLVSLGQNCDKDIFESKQSCSVNIPVITKGDLKTREQISKLLNDTTSLLNNSNGLVITQDATLNGMKSSQTIIRDKKDKELSMYSDAMGLLSEYIFYTQKDFGAYLKNSNKWTKLDVVTKKDIDNIFNESILDTNKIKDIKYFDNITVEEDNNFIILKGTTQISSALNNKFNDITNQSNSSQFNNFNGKLNFEMKINRYNKHLKSFKVYSNFMGMNISSNTYIDQMDNAPKVLPIKNIESGGIPKEASKGELEVHFINVGHGDATYIKTPDGNDILIDTGKQTHYTNTVYPYIDNLIIDNKIEAFIISHVDNDHIGGALDVLNTFKVDNIYMSDISKLNYKETQTYKNLKNKINPIIANKGTCLPFSDIETEFLAPDLNSNYNYKNVNDISNVLYIKYQKNSFIFTGDIEDQIVTDKKSYPLFTYGKLPVDVLKVPHHGSYTSTSDDLLNIFEPKYVIINENTNTKPNKDVMERLKKYKSVDKIFITGYNGTIVFKSDGQNLRYSVSLEDKYDDFDFLYREEK